MGGLQIPRWLGSDPLSVWWLGLAPVTLEFWVRFPNERNQGKQAHPVLKGRRRVEDMCYERRQAEACVDESAHHALVNAGGREIV